MQQGDVIIERCDSMPDGKPGPVKGGKLILAEGEVTGHAHRVEKVANMEFVEKDGMFYLKSDTPFTVEHEEHKEITVPAGIYKVRGVKEYDHWAEEARRVAD